MTDDVQYNLYNLISHLKKIKGAINYDGECSVQVVIPLVDGTHIRVGITDCDITENGDQLWFDFYEGLRLSGTPEGDLTHHFRNNGEENG